MNKPLSDKYLFLFTCSGEDNYILKKCNWGIQKRFALIGFFVLLIFFSCFFSATLFTFSLFEGLLLFDILFGIIWGAIIANIYLLLLHTISPAIIPLSAKKNTKKINYEIENKSSFFSLSMVLRIVFMILLAVIIAQPLNIVILSSSVNSSSYLKTIQILLIENHNSWIITSLVCLVFLLPIYFKYKARDISTKIFQSENHKPEIVRLRNELIKTTDFDWLENKIISINVNQIKTSDYYFMRMLIEHRTILIEYKQTKDEFSKILTDNVKQYNKSVREKLNPLLAKLKSINQKRYQVYQELVNTELKDEIIVKYEHWLDMPFRTNRAKTVAITNTEVGLLDFVYNKNDEEGTEEI